MAGGACRFPLAGIFFKVMSDSSKPPRAPGTSSDAEGSLERLRVLEATVVELKLDVAMLRRELDAARAASTPTTSDAVSGAPRAMPPLHASRTSDETLRAALRAEMAGQSRASTSMFTEHRHSRISGFVTTQLDASALESFIGRYGMPIIGGVAVLAATGTFIGWAIAKGWLTPPVRVLIGLILAGSLAMLGLRMRRRERSFGSSLLGLALAITHVCAWGSGPALHLVPDAIAFAGVALASIALAAFAHREADQPLWCVGFSGAAIAPFVSSYGNVRPMLLALYGAVVLLSACWALRGRSWSVAERVLQSGTSLFVVALATMPERHAGPLFAVGLPIVVAVGGAMPSAARTRLRSRLRALGLITALAALRAGAESQPVLPRLWLAVFLGAAGVVWLALVDQSANAPATLRSSEQPRDTDSFFEWLDACWIPLLITTSTIVGLDDGRWGTTWMLVGSAVVLLAFVARRRAPGGFLRDAGAFAVGVTVIAAMIVAESDSTRTLTAAAAGIALGLLVLHRWRPSRSWLALAALSLLGASAASMAQLTDRVPYVYAPFGTNESAVALAVAIVWGVAALWAAQLIAAVPSSPREDSYRNVDFRERQMRRFVNTTRALAIGWTFLWVNVELAHAVRHTTALLLLITYYAVTAVASVWLGRWRDSAHLRRVGLALALLAALVAFRGARGIDAVAVRITGYLVTAVFLLGIAFWYRRPGPLPEGPSDDTRMPDEPPVGASMSTTA